MDWNTGTAARTVWQEARGEPLEGQKAVAHVIINRLRSGRWGKSLAEVCLDHAEFSGWRKPPSDPNFAPACRLSDDAAPLVGFAALISAAMEGEPDPTGGATHYHAKSIPAPIWVVGDHEKSIPPAIFCGRFGNQLFYRGVA